MTQLPSQSYFPVRAVAHPAADNIRETQDVTVTVVATDHGPELHIDIDDGWRIEVARGSAAYLAGALAAESGVQFG